MGVLGNTKGTWWTYKIIGSLKGSKGDQEWTKGDQEEYEVMQGSLRVVELDEWFSRGAK